VVSDEVSTRDTERIQAGLSVVECAREVREQRSDNRFNPARCENMIRGSVTKMFPRGFLPGPLVMETGSLG
jgi:hypothetical protein